MALLLECEGAAPRDLAYGELVRLPEQIPDVGALIPGRDGAGVWLRALLDAAARPLSARWATLASEDGAFSISVPLDALLEHAVLQYRLGEGPLPVSKGGPVRVLLVGAVECQAEGLDLCASVKHLGRIRLTSAREPDVGHHH